MKQPEEWNWGARMKRCWIWGHFWEVFFSHPWMSGANLAVTRGKKIGRRSTLQRKYLPWTETDSIELSRPYLSHLWRELAVSLLFFPLFRKTRECFKILKKMSHIHNHERGKNDFPLWIYSHSVNFYGRSIHFLNTESWWS